MSEIRQLVKYSFVTSALNVIGSYLIPFLVACFTHKISISDQQVLKKLRPFILKRVIFQTNTDVYNGGSTAASGWHLAMVDGWPVLVSIGSEAKVISNDLVTVLSLTVVSFTRKTLPYIQNMCISRESPNRMSIRVYERFSWRSTFISKTVCIPGKPTREQIGAVNMIEKMISSEDSDKCGAVLLIGPSGTGKSSTGIFLAQALREKKMSVIVTIGFNPLTKGAVFTDIIYPDPHEGFVQIVMLEELDRSFEMAERNQEATTDMSCIAQSKATLNNFLDEISRTPSTVVIATTNMSMEELKKKKYDGYVRKGRFNLHIEYENKLHPVLSDS